MHNNIYNILENTPTENVDATPVQDNVPLLSALHGYNCSLILHGHKHQQRSCRINLSTSIPEQDRLCPVISGGTLKNSMSDSFNYFEIGDREIIKYVYSVDGGAFKHTGTFDDISKPTIIEVPAGATEPKKTEPLKKQNELLERMNGDLKQKVATLGLSPENKTQEMHKLIL